MKGYHQTVLVLALVLVFCVRVFFSALKMNIMEYQPARTLALLQVIRQSIPPRRLFSWRTSFCTPFHGVTARDPKEGRWEHIDNTGEDTEESVNMLTNRTPWFYLWKVRWYDYSEYSLWRRLAWILDHKKISMCSGIRRDVRKNMKWCP